MSSLLICAEDGWIVGWKNQQSVGRWSYHAANKYSKTKVVVLVESGEVFILKPIIISQNKIIRIVEKMFNLHVDVNYEYIETKYGIDDFRKLFMSALDSDDDIVTQEIDRNTVISKIENCAHFVDFVALYNELNLFEG